MHRIHNDPCLTWTVGDEPTVGFLMVRGLLVGIIRSWLRSSSSNSLLRCVCCSFLSLGEVGLCLRAESANSKSLSFALWKLSNARKHFLQINPLLPSPNKSSSLITWLFPSNTIPMISLQEGATCLLASLHSSLRYVPVVRFVPHPRQWTAVIFNRSSHVVMFSALTGSANLDLSIEAHTFRTRTF